MALCPTETHNEHTCSMMLHPKKANSATLEYWIVSFAVDIHPTKPEVDTEIQKVTVYKINVATIKRIKNWLSVNEESLNQGGF